VIGLDANVVVRYLTQDDPIQARKATEIIEHRLTEAKPGFVSVVVMAEIVWVLDRAYSFSAQQIGAAIERMLQVEVLVVEKEQEVFAAMVAFKQGRGAFADALIAQLAMSAGCAHTLTFHNRAVRLPGFRLA
jgi:predicted nucleic-acid-binding protein